MDTMNAPPNIMNSFSCRVLGLYSYDEHAGRT